MPQLSLMGTVMGPSTKGTSHLRRTGGYSAVIVSFKEDMKSTLSKKQFLSNKENKQNFINMLGVKLE